MNQRKYCEQHKLDYLSFSGRLSKRHPAWDKITLMKMVLPFYDAALWMDSDCIFNNFHKKIPVIEKDGLFIRDPFYTEKNRHVQLVNCGVFLLRNCTASTKFLDAVDQESKSVDAISKRSYDGWPWEQGPISVHLLNQSHNFIIDQNMDMNCHPSMANPETFIIHYMGWRTNQETENAAISDIDRRNMILLHG